MPDATAAATPRGLTPSQAIAKRALDVAVAVVALILGGWLILLGAAASAMAHGGSGFFVQRRVGRHGAVFPLLKLKTMRDGTGLDTTVTLGWTASRTARAWSSPSSCSYRGPSPSSRAAARCSAVTRL